MLTPTPAEFLAALPPRQRLLGLDVGEKTIGCGMSDVDRSIASPHSTITRTNWKKDAAALLEIITAHNICGLVIGYPVNMDGTEGPRCQSIRQFARNVDKFLQPPLPLLLWDERLSTSAVTRGMLEGDLSRQKRAKHVDKLAAAYILQGVLDFRGLGIRD